MSAQFTDSVTGTLEMIRELIQQMPPSSRGRAKRAAVMIENAWEAMRKDHKGDNATALGAAFAIFTLAERLVQPEEAGTKSQGDKLIHLLQ
jgi:hypothetical protein